MSKKTLDIIGIGSLLVSLVAQIVSDWVEEQSIDALIDEKLEERGLGKK